MTQHSELAAGRETIDFEEGEFKKAVGKMYFVGALSGAGNVLLVVGLLLVLNDTSGWLQSVIGLSSSPNTAVNAIHRTVAELLSLATGVLLTTFSTFRWQRFLKLQREYFNRLSMSNPPSLRRAIEYV
jgi:hypothetical protein